MPSPQEIVMGPFAKGLVTAIQPHLLPPDAATDNLAADYATGSIQGLYGPGTALAATVPANSVFAFWAGKAAWVSSLYENTGLNDAPKADGTGISYTTNRTGAGAVSYPLCYEGVTPYRLGIAAPTVGPTVTTGSGGLASNVAKTYAFTYVTANGYESNVGPRTSSSGGASNSVKNITVPAAPSANVTAMRLYATKQLDSSGILYFLAELAPGATHSGDNDVTTSDTTRPVNWGLGGNYRSALLSSDHSPAPNLTILSNAVHGSVEDGGNLGSGIIFGAVDNIVYWSIRGYPFYWPTFNKYRLNETVQALVTYKTQTIALTDSAVYTFTGVTDTGITPNRAGGIGVAHGAGRSAVTSPYGILYRAREGLAAFSGGEPSIFTEGLLDADLLGDGGYNLGAYFDHTYFLFGATDTLAVDMRSFPNVRVTRVAQVVKAAHVTPYDPAGGSQGLYVVNAAGAIAPWRPVDGADVPGATRQAWEHHSGTFKARRLMRARPTGAGAATFAFYKDDEATPCHTEAIADLAMAESFRLPGARCRHISVKASGTGRLDELRIETEVF